MAALDFSEQDLVGNIFNGQNLNGSTFFKATLTNVSFASIPGGLVTRLRDTNFEETSWLNVDATGARFRPLNTETSFFKASLEDVNFTDAALLN